MKPKMEGAFGGAVQEVGEELDVKDYEIRLQEFESFMQDDGPEGYKHIEQVIADLEAKIKDKCPAEYEAMNSETESEDVGQEKPAKKGKKK